MGSYGFIGFVILVVFSLPVACFADLDPKEEADKIVEYMREQSEIAKVGGSADKVYKYVGKSWDVHNNISKECDRLDVLLYGMNEYNTSAQKKIETTYKYDTCKLWRDGAADFTASVMFISAGYYEKRDKKKARQIYRDIITTFTGDAYKSHVKRAEFALEDLKSMPHTDKKASKRKGKSKKQMKAEDE